MHKSYLFYFTAIAAILGSATAATTSNIATAAAAAAISDNLDEYSTVAVLPSAIAATLAAAPAVTTPQNENGAIAAPSIVPVPQAAPQLPTLAYDKVGISDGVEFSPICFRKAIL
ncbi:unnamed protein product [Ceratitis capitata]|uniref:(Mediterranean fruit fly) hypothetical protein n=1 Tax=Ceratitis capitata TaxID=7213 RepID=A0A811UGU8_CERCA|nr:unnamed protein product [Ceratitis capitata]